MKLTIPNKWLKKNCNNEQICKTSQKYLKNSNEDDNFSKYNAIKNELYVIYDHIKEDIGIRSKCDWFLPSKK